MAGKAKLAKFWNLTRVNNGKVSAARLAAVKISLQNSAFDDAKERRG